MLNNYIQQNKTKIIFGKGTHHQIGEELIKLNVKKVLLHYDSGEFIKPLIILIKKLLEEKEIKVFELGGVVPNPKLSLMKQGCEIVKEEKIDFILAVGGGSTMDSTKYIACGSYYQGELWSHLPFKEINTPIIKHGVIVTMPGTGSEVSTAAVWRNDLVTPETKTCVFANEMRFDLVIINPELHYTLPKFQTAAGSFDIISHSLEDYFCIPLENEFSLSSYEGIIREVMKNLKIVLKDSQNYDARASLARLAYVPLEDILNMGFKRGYCVHNLEKPMTAQYHKTHGEMLAILFPAWFKYCYKMNPQLFSRISINCFGAKKVENNLEETILNGIKNLEDFISEIGLPTRLSQVGIDNRDFEYCADYSIENSQNDYIGEGIKLYKEDILNVYRLAL